MQSGLAPYRDQAPLVWMAPEGAEGQAATPGTPVGPQAGVKGQNVCPESRIFTD